ncbi:MAG: substrate-binding domain-containing protein [Thermodesulfobacteriota bacterium]
MKRRVTWFAMVVATIMVSWAMPFTAKAQEKLRYSCSAQVFEALEKERIQAFTKATGIEVDLYVASSSVSIERLMSGLSDIASMPRGGTYPLKEGGYAETPFSKDPLAIIINARGRLTNLTEEQLRGIFSKKITNWKQLGGPNETIILVVPGRNTAAYENFGHLAMKQKEIHHDIMTNLSTTALEVVKRFPAAISFVTLGAIGKAGGVKTVKINGFSPKDKGYPYFQEFSFVTKGKPAGAAKTFVDFTLSEKGKEIIEKRGMIPIGPKE